MKKLLLLLLIPFLLSGCYDYNELNELAIVSGIGIDYVDNEFLVTFEILSTKKEGDNSSSSSAYTVSAKGDTVTKAFSLNGNKLDKVPYYDHIEVVVISEEVAKNHLKEVAEYLIRSSKLRNEFYLTITTKNSAKDVISCTKKEKPIASIFIVSLLENSTDSSSAGYYEPFTKTLRKILTKGEDAALSVLNLKEDAIILDGMGVFKDFELKHVFNNEEAFIINLLNNFKTKTAYFEKTCEGDKKTVISIYESDLSIEPSHDKVVVSGKLNGRINENNCEYDLKKEDTYLELEKEFTKIIEKKMEHVLTTLKKVESNALSIGKNYYNKYRVHQDLLWTRVNIQYDLNLKLNKKGLVFTVD